MERIKLLKILMFMNFLEMENIGARKIAGKFLMLEQNHTLKFGKTGAENQEDVCLGN